MNFGWKSSRLRAGRVICRRGYLPMATSHRSKIFPDTASHTTLLDIGVVDAMDASEISPHGEESLKYDLFDELIGVIRAWKIIIE
jgi:hypothetical protein